jgi:hypothetical protein
VIETNDAVNWAIVQLRGELLCIVDGFTAQAHCQIALAVDGRSIVDI